MQKSLKILLKDFLPECEIPDIQVNGLSSDSRQLKAGEVFFAYPGLKTDGRKFLKQVQQQAIAAIVCERAGLEAFHEILIELEDHIPIISLHDIQAKLSEMAARFYDYPARAMTVIGVTGTNGKTSCTHFIAQILNQQGTACAVMGTLGYGIPPRLTETQFTTQDAISVQKNLSELRAQQVKVVAMEVSSHGLAQHRVDAVDFSIAAFTQLSRDHLDYHQSLEEYAAAKERLFHFPSLKHIVVNADDEMGLRLLKTCQPQEACLAYSLNPDCLKEVKASGCVLADTIALRPQGFALHVRTPWGEGSFETPLLGRFNLSNSLLVLAVLGSLQLSLADILAGLSALHMVSGRLESFGGEHSRPQVIVDYAHTPDALEKVLLTLREHCRGKLWCVFGCGGDRDRGKRPLMAAVAERLSDRIVLTDDNPRSESPEQIALDIQQGFTERVELMVILDRASAIKYAIQNASANDIILVAGKGHEDYQLIGTERLAFSDREQVEQALREKL